MTLTLAGRLVAQDAGAAVAANPSAPADDPRATLDAYFKAFASKRLVSSQAANVGELRAMLSTAEELAQSGRDEDAVLLLFELTQHPRFADYVDLQEMDAAHYALGSSLHALGAEQSARAALRRVLQKGPEGPYFAPAFRRYVDVALAGEPLAPSLSELAAYGQKLPEDAQNERSYLQGRERYDAGDFDAAKQAFASLTRHSRFYANAQYLLGAMASQEKRWDQAEGHFCKIATAGDNGRFSFYVDGRYFRIKDLARLGLGRVAHEQKRGDDAFYYYFQVPTDSARVPESMFEAAYARYESADYETAIDLLDQLEARYPRSAFADEASLLRGYVALSHCDFDQANGHFERFIRRFDPVSQEIDRVLRNPARREALYEELNSDPEARQGSSPVHRTLLALLRIDPVFSDLHERLRKLDQEAARAGHLRGAFELIGARYAGADQPRPLPETSPTDQRELTLLREELSDTRRAVHALDAQLDAMRALGTKPATLSPHEASLAALATRLRKLESALDDLRLDLMPGAAPEASANDVQQLLTHDAVQATDFEKRVIGLRPKLVSAANDRAFAELTALRDRLAGFLRRARIGRIDAVMGSKRRVEIQIESLAAGRFPAELRNPLLIQGFLANDEEYWPFEGEDWPDEYLERYGDEASQGKP
jgi:TolA-binding protein